VVEMEVAKLWDALIGHGGGDITLEMAAALLAARMAGAGACTMSRRCGRIGDTKAVIRQPIDRMIRRLLIAVDIARCRCAGIGDLRRGRPADRCRGADVSPTSIWSIVAGHVMRISDITKPGSSELCGIRRRNRAAIVCDILERLQSCRGIGLEGPGSATHCQTERRKCRPGRHQTRHRAVHSPGLAESAS